MGDDRFGRATRRQKAIDAADVSVVLIPGAGLGDDADRIPLAQQDALNRNGDEPATTSLP